MTDQTNLTPIDDQDLKQKLLRQASEVAEGHFELRTTWIREHGWTAVPVEGACHFDETDATRLADAMQEAGWRECYAVGVEEVPAGSAPQCALVRATPEGLIEFSDECGSFGYLLMPADLSFAVLCTYDNYYHVAGPQDFVRRAVGGDIQQAREQFVEFASTVDEGWADRRYGRALLNIARRCEEASQET